MYSYWKPHLFIDYRRNMCVYYYLLLKKSIKIVVVVVGCFLCLLLLVLCLCFSVYFFFLRLFVSHSMFKICKEKKRIEKKLTYFNVFFILMKTQRKKLKLIILSIFITMCITLQYLYLLFFALSLVLCIYSVRNE